MKPTILFVLAVAWVWPALATTDPNAQTKCAVVGGVDPTVQPPEQLTRTRAGRKPSEYFADKTVPEKGKPDRPRFVLLVGIAGSGKSTWAAEAARQGWTVLTHDEVMKEVLTEMRAAKTMLNIWGEGMQLANPDNPTHFRAVDKAEVDRIVLERVKKAAAEGKPIVVDFLNVFPDVRSPLLSAARAAGYHTDALQFETADVRFNANNLRLRAGAGGMSLGRSEAEELDALARINRRMQRTPLGVRPGHYAVTERPPGWLERDAYDRWLGQNDYVNRLDVVDVRDWSQP